eukprot:2166478-Amphidinium_carterae.1
MSKLVKYCMAWDSNIRTIVAMRATPRRICISPSTATVANTLHKTNDETTALIASLQVSKVEERWPPDLSDPYVMPRGRLRAQQI